MLNKRYSSIFLNFQNTTLLTALIICRLDLEFQAL